MMSKITSVYRVIFTMLCLSLLIMPFNILAQKGEMPITTSSKEAKDLFLQGREKLENIELTAAAPLFDQAIEADSNFALAYCFRALSGGGTQVLRANMEKAGALADKVSDGERFLIKYYQAANEANRAKQVEYLDTLLAMFPQDKRVKMYAGRYYRSMGDYKIAIAHFKKAIEIDKEFAPLYNFLGYCNLETENFEAAEKAFKEYIRLVPNKPNPYDSYAELLLKMRRYDESIEQYQKAYDTDNAFVRSLYGVGNNYVFKGDFDKAREFYQMYFDKAASVEQKLGALYLKALTFMYENKPDEAIKVFEERRLLAEKENQPTTVVYSYVYEGYALAELGKPTEALKKFEEAIAMIEKVDLSEQQQKNLRMESNFWLAYSYASNNMLDKAKSSAALFKQDVDLRNNPDDKNGLNWILAFIDFKEGKYEAAIDQFAAMDPDPLTMFYQAQAYLKKGDKEAANGLLNKIANWNQNSFNLAAAWSRTQKALGK